MYMCLFLLLCVVSKSLCDRLITCTDESYGCLSLLSVVCCQVEVCAKG